MSLSRATLNEIDAKMTKNHAAETINTHLTEVFNRCMMHNKLDAYDKFEEVSSLVKKTNLEHREAQEDKIVNMPAKSKITDRMKH
jgi:hypothetical protein